MADSILEPNTEKFQPKKNPFLKEKLQLLPLARFAYSGDSSSFQSLFSGTFSVGIGGVARMAIAMQIWNQVQNFVILQPIFHHYWSMELYNFIIGAKL